MAEVRIVHLDTDPQTAGVRSVTLEVQYEGKGGVAVILLRPDQLLPRTERALRDDLRQLAAALLEAPILPPKSPSIPLAQQ
jgi:hypothetical protein